MVHRSIKPVWISALGALFLAGCQPDEPVVTAPAPDDPPATVDLADALYFGGPIVTVDDALPSAEAVAVREGRIQAVGPLADLEALAGPDTRRVDLDGRTLVPGFVDGHVHVNGLGLQAMGANLLASPDGEVDTIDDLVDTMRQWAQESNDDERFGWIFGMGFDDAVLEERRFPNRDDLDRVSTEWPVIAIHISGHFASVNSKGLEVIGYTSETPDPEGGIIRRRPGSNEPDGVLEELAAIPVFFRELSPREPEDVRYAMAKGLELAMSFGYTTAQEGRAFGETHEALAGYAETVGFPIDVVSYIDYSSLSPLESDWYGNDYRNG